MKAREDASAALLNYGFTFFETVRLQQAGKAVLQAAGLQGRERRRSRSAARATSA